MKLNQTTIYVTKVSDSCSFLEAVLSIKADYQDDHFAQLRLADHIIMLTKTDTIPSLLTLHLEVEDVDAEKLRLEQAGFELKQKPVLTDWGTYSLLVSGPDGLVLDFYTVV